MRELWRLRRPVALAALAAIIALALAFGLSYLAVPVFDKLIPSSTAKGIADLAVVALALASGRAVAEGIRGAAVATSGCTMQIELAGAYLDSVFLQPAADFRAQSQGDMLAGFTDISAASHSITGIVLSLGLDGILAGAGIVTLALRSPLLAMVLAACLATASAVAWASSTKLLRGLRAARSAMGEAYGRLADALSAIRSIKSCSAERRVAATIGQAHAKAQFAQKSVAWRAAAAGSLVVGLSSVVTSTVLLLGAWFVIRGAMTVGQLVFFFGVAGLVTGPAERLLPSIVTIQDAAVGIERVSAAIASKPEQPRAPILDPQTKIEEIELANVGLFYSSVAPALTDVNFRIRAAPGSRVLAVLGKTGSGKTTLACVLAGIYQPAQGRILLNGHPDVSNGGTLRSVAALVLQESELMDGTVAQNIRLGVPDADAASVAEAAHTAVADFILRLPRGFDTRIGPGGLALSAGQRQRIALARALVRKPLLLILDEATANLDIETEAELFANLREAQGRGSPAMLVLMTHRLPLAALADQVIVLEDGRIVESGTLTSLLAFPGWTHRAWRAQAAQVAEGSLRT